LPPAIITAKEKIKNQGTSTARLCPPFFSGEEEEAFPSVCHKWAIFLMGGGVRAHGRGFNRITAMGAHERPLFNKLL